MAYNNAIPQATDRISQSQPQILANFQAISTLINVNHENFDIASQGKHKFLQMPEQAGDPATIANEVALYSKQGTINNVAELFFKRESNGTVINFTESGQDIKGWARLPSGILIKWGDDTSTGNQLKTFPVVDSGANAIPAFTLTPWIILFICTQAGFASWDLTGVNSATQYTISTFSSTGSGLTARTFRFLAIGT